jgi:hypothetical protein
MAWKRRKKISTLGTLAILLGTLAWVTTRNPVLGFGPVKLGAGGAVLGLLAVFGAAFLGNTGRMIPLMGLLISVSAATFGIVYTVDGQDLADRLKQWTNRVQQTPQISNPQTPTTAPAVPTKQTEASADESVGKGTIFDMKAGDHGASATEMPVPMPSNQPPVAAIPPASSSPTQISAAVRVAEASDAVDAAQKKVAAAKANLLPGLAKTPAFQTAQNELTAATAAWQGARADSADPGSAAAVAAGERYLNAKTAVQRLIDEASSTDPLSIAAKQELAAAEKELAAARAELATSIAAGSKASGH